MADGWNASIPVDWRVATVVGGRLVRPGPVAPRGKLDEFVAELRSAADRAVDHVVSVTQMHPADGRDLATEPLSTVHVIDRPRWIEANADVMRAMLGPSGLADTKEQPEQDAQPEQDRQGPEHEQGSDGGAGYILTHADATAQVVGGAQVGAALALVAGKVLGQLDPYASASPERGRLLLVAPNILAVQRALRLVASDFNLWVCLHEQTHALQFAAAPWLAQHMIARTGRLLDDMTGQSRELSSGPLAARGRAAATAIANFVRAGRGTSIVDRFLTPDQRREMADIGAVMALLEGHADVVMDDVGPAVVPSVRKIRRAFDARRQDVRARDFIVRKLLGMDAKMAQYRDGAVFVRAVLAAGGQELLNVVWTDARFLPTAQEIADPSGWLRRIDT